MTAARLRVLTYHDVTEPARFRRQLDQVQRTLRPVTLARVHAALAGGEPLPRRAVLLTFDDGLPSHVDLVGPELARRGLQGVFYAVLGVLGTSTPFWWDAILARRAALELRPVQWAGRSWADAARLVSASKTAPDAQRLELLATLDADHGPPPAARQLGVDELRSLVQAGHVVGNHSWTHPLLDTLTDGALDAELDRAHDSFVRHFPDQPRTFAYPNGNHDGRTVRWLAAHDYRSAFLFDHGLCRAGRPLEISRLRVSETVPSLRWASTLLGLEALRVRLRPGATLPAQRRLRVDA